MKKLLVLSSAVLMYSANLMATPPIADPGDPTWPHRLCAAFQSLLCLIGF